MMGRIFADFNRMRDDESGGKVHIGVEGSWQIEQYRPLKWLSPGAVVKLHDGELEVEAVIEFDERNGSWYGRPNWSTRRDLSSIADGLEDYGDATPDQKLTILRIELLPLIGAIGGYAHLLQEIDPNIAQGLPAHFSKWIDGLARATGDLKIILDALTRPQN